MYSSLILRDFAFIEHYFFNKIVILTKLSATYTVWFKLLESASETHEFLSAYNNILP